MNRKRDGRRRSKLATPPKTSKRAFIESGLDQGSSEFASLLFYWIDQLYMRLDDVFVPPLEAAGISRPLWILFGQIKQHPGLTQRDLARLLDRDKVRLGRKLDLLEKKGLIERVPSETDRRAKHIYPIFPKKVLALMRRIDDDAFALSFDDVPSKELKVFCSVLEHVVRRLR